jgi:FixJ family two-component response regulator
MNVIGEAHILIIDDDQQTCRLLGEFISAWGMRFEAITQPLRVVDELKASSYDIFLLDVFMPEITGLELIPEISRLCPDAKIIMMTGYADKETAIKALKLGAFDLLEKPFQRELLHHALTRALEVLEKERNHKYLVENLKRSQAELLAHKERLEYLNEQLMQTNRAFSVLAQNIAREREETEKRIARKLRTLVIPAIDKLRRDKNLSRYGEELDMLVSQIVEDLTSGFDTDGRIASSLSFTELRIASLIKGGLTSEEIARQLHISSSTVRTHRKNIRKKLRINNAGYSLRNFLISKSGKSPDEGFIKTG